MKTNYQELIVWQKGIELVKRIYIITKLFPKEEMYGIVSQIRRSAVSIPSNIAEGSQRLTSKDFIKYIAIAKGSGAELETQLIISKELGYIDENDLKNIQPLIIEILKMLSSLINKLSAKD